MAVDNFNNSVIDIKTVYFCSVDVSSGLSRSLFSRIHVNTSNRINYSIFSLCHGHNKHKHERSGVSGTRKLQFELNILQVDGEIVIGPEFTLKQWKVLFFTKAIDVIHKNISYFRVGHQMNVNQHSTCVALQRRNYC